MHNLKASEYIRSFAGSLFFQKADIQNITEDKGFKSNCIIY